MTAISDSVKIFTDGACRGNPGPGGWGAVLQYPDKEQELYGGESNTTNNRMELMAAIVALESLKSASKVVLTTDSTYVKNGISEWLPGWKKKGWLTAAKKPVKNKDLWQRLDNIADQHQVEWCWVKGHSGHVENDRADGLANRAIDEQLGR